jgi:dipeptidyl aminopeptidase/acylaminoacyl peptidase
VWNADATAFAFLAIGKTAITDPERVGVSGHSHGALMTANLLAYSDLFRAGVARSGAYNRSNRTATRRSSRSRP